MTDKISAVKFLIDTGADISVVPKSFVNHHQSSSDFKLFAANGTPINTYGQKLITVNFGLKRAFPFIFVVADVDRAIVGADFLTKFNLLVDVANKRLLDSVTRYRQVVRFLVARLREFRQFLR